MSKHAYWIVIGSASLALYGCGTSHEEFSGVDGSNPSGDGAGNGTQGAPGPSTCAGEPPKLVLSTLAGDQQGEQGSYCISNDRAGCGLCADVFGDRMPKHYSVVHAGDEVTLRVLGGSLGKPANVICEPDCPPQMRIVPLSCDQTGETRILPDGDVWQIEAAPGTHKIFVDAGFESDDGTYGQTDVMFGLIVDDAREPAIVDASSEAAVSCDAGS